MGESGLGDNRDGKMKEDSQNGTGLQLTVNSLDWRTTEMVNRMKIHKINGTELQYLTVKSLDWRKTEMAS